MDGTIQYRQSALITVQVLRAECNVLSQFKEDTGKPSMPVQKFNLISCPIARSDLDLNPQPVSPAGTVAYEQWFSPPSRWDRLHKIMLIIILYDILILSILQTALVTHLSYETAVHLMTHQLTYKAWIHDSIETRK